MERCDGFSSGICNALPNLFVKFDTFVEIAFLVATCRSLLDSIWAGDALYEHHCRVDPESKMPRTNQSREFLLVTLLGASTNYS